MTSILIWAVSLSLPIKDSDQPGTHTGMHSIKLTMSPQVYSRCRDKDRRKAAQYCSLPPTPQNLNPASTHARHLKGTGRCLLCNRPFVFKESIFLMLNSLTSRFVNSVNLLTEVPMARSCTIQEEPLAFITEVMNIMSNSLNEFRFHVHSPTISLLLLVVVVVICLLCF